VNAFAGYEVGFGKNQLTGETQRFPEIANRYHEADQAWIVIGDENMGEGSSREHAAMEPRFRMGLVAIARSFARIHETNLKKQGMVPLTFVDPADYDKIGEDDRVNVVSLPPVPGETVRCEIIKPDSSIVPFECNHTFSPEQVEWFEAGSALNIIRRKSQG
jgi:aconitate hydratase